VQCGSVSPRALDDSVFYWAFLLKGVCACSSFKNLRLSVACYCLNVAFESRFVLII
jgi:hypothetical protein